MTTKFINPSLFILFGSQSKGNATNASDFDIGVVANNPLGFEEKSKLSEDVSKEFSFPEEKVEIVDLNEASPLLQMEAVKTGKLLKGKESDFFKYKLLVWKRYLHSAKFRQLRSKYLEKIYG